MLADLLPLFDLGPQGAPARKALQQASKVYLSPHFDDVAFSLGLCAGLLGGGVLLNLFTRSMNLPNAAMSAERKWTTDEISELRCDEDARFAASAGLKQINLDCEEPPLRGRHSKQLAGLVEDREQLREPLRAALTDLANTLPAPLVLFCPAAIGGHVNHLATMYTVVEMLDDLRPRYSVFFYEDLPYASSFWRRQWGLARLSRLPGVRLATRNFLRLGEERAKKLAIVNSYASQQRHPAGIRRYSPCTPRPFAAHEAFWGPPL